MAVKPWGSNLILCLLDRRCSYWRLKPESGSETIRICILGVDAFNRHTS